MPKTEVKNRAAAGIQITAEQLLREAKERDLDGAPPPPTQFITDRDELVEYQRSKRKDFEDQLRRQRQHIGTWCRYGLWEAAQKEFERARSIFERALDVDYRNQTLWLKYADMEMKNQFINHARNIWDRAVTLHPRVDTLWYKYTYMEELVGASDNCRQVFERWMQWEPDDNAWSSFIKFEMRQGQMQRARSIYERYVALLPTAVAYLKYAKWEEKQHQKALARSVFERSLSELHPFERNEKLLTNFARFEERCKEFERSRTIYQYAINQSISKDMTDDVAELKKEFMAFEKRHGDKTEIEDAVLTQRREVYEGKLQMDRYDYDTWFDYIRLEQEESGDSEKIRGVYSRAIENTPPVAEKKYWRRYIYLWINYALYEELVEKDIEKARAIYRECLDSVIPHKQFTFGKIWLLAAQLEVRRKELPAMRKLLGWAIGMTKKPNVFKGYIELEYQLGEVDRCREIYKKYVQASPLSFTAWNNFAQLEVTVEEPQRARAIFEIAVSVEDLDSPELAWKSYIDFEIGEREIDNVRGLYLRLLERSNHVKIWISYANFEAEMTLAVSAGSFVSETKEGEEEGEGDSSSGKGKEASEEGKMAGFNASRDVFVKGYDTLKAAGLKEERLILLESWRDMESLALSNGVGSMEKVVTVESKFPRKIKMKRDATDQDESEYYYDYIFPDDEKKVVGMKLLERAMQWKKIGDAFGGAIGDANGSGSGGGD